MYIVYVEYDGNSENCKPYSGREYYSKQAAEKELKDAESDPEVFIAWIEEV